MPKRRSVQGDWPCYIVVTVVKLVTRMAIAIVGLIVIVGLGLGLDKLRARPLLGIGLRCY